MSPFHGVKVEPVHRPELVDVVERETGGIRHGVGMGARHRQTVAPGGLSRTGATEYGPVLADACPSSRESGLRRW